MLKVIFFCFYRNTKSSFKYFHKLVLHLENQNQLIESFTKHADYSPLSLYFWHFGGNREINLEDKHSPTLFPPPEEEEEGSEKKKLCFLTCLHRLRPSYSCREQQMGEEEEDHDQPHVAGDVPVISTHQDQDQDQDRNEAYSWPVIRFDVPPTRTYHFCHQFRNTPNPNNFLKSLKWFLPIFLFVFFFIFIFFLLKFNFMGFYFYFH